MTTRPLPEAFSSPAQATAAPAHGTGARQPSPAATGLATDVAAFLGGKQVEDLQILDVSRPLAIVDYFVIGTVRTTRQAQAIARELDQEMKGQLGKRRRNHGGLETQDSNWVLLDFDDVVVHLFLPEARAYYGLESLWADAPRLPVPAPRESRVAQRPARRDATTFQVFPEGEQ